MDWLKRILERLRRRSADDVERAFSYQQAEDPDARSRASSTQTTFQRLMNHVSSWRDPRSMSSSSAMDEIGRHDDSPSVMPYQPFNGDAASLTGANSTPPESSRCTVS